MFVNLEENNRLMVINPEVDRHAVIPNELAAPVA